MTTSEKMYLVCRGCGEACDTITFAHLHGNSDPSGCAGWCGEDGFDLLPESEAM
jgi:formylmethanofuran dehydrogenase subunit B